jgi:hypothetical protein
MSKKLTYTNRKGDLYTFREVSGKRGTKIVCSQKESADDLAAIPKTHEIIESPNGQVSCRKKMKSNITRDEASYAEDILPSMMDPNIRLFVETKKNALIIHSADTSDSNEIAKFAIKFCADPAGTKAITERNLRYEPVLKLELADKVSRIFAAYRMCWIGPGEKWMFLKAGSVYTLVEELGPHIGQESFFELF